MRHQDEATAKRATIWQDLVRGVAVFAICLAVIVPLAIWTSYVAGSVFVLGVAVLDGATGFVRHLLRASSAALRPVR